VQALVDARSPQAAPVLESLVAYLRAAVPRLDDPAHRLGHELDTVRAYLALMRLRMPDRLRFSIELCDGVVPRAVRCPPLMLMTLVENAIRHGIDPSLDGGEVSVAIRRLEDGRLLASVRDTGVGLSALSQGLGTGLDGLRERLREAFGGRASLRLTELTPNGMLAEVEFPLES
jgi:LytS/YehU family sensor histidine kinase